MSADSRSPVVGELVRFEWDSRVSAATDVRVSGDFVGWTTTGLPLKREAVVKGESEWTTSSQEVFSLVLRLKPGTHQYRYIVDGEWMYHPAQPLGTDSSGNIVNVVTVKGVPGVSEDSTGAAAPGGGYIGMGVAREMFEEFHLTVEPARHKASMPRSATLNDVSSLAAAGASASRPWVRTGGGPAGSLAARGLLATVATPRVGAAARTMDANTRTSDLDLSAGAAPMMVVVTSAPAAVAGSSVFVPSGGAADEGADGEDSLGMPLESGETASATSAPMPFFPVNVTSTSPAVAASESASGPTPRSSSSLGDAGSKPSKSASTSSMSGVAVDKATVGIPVSIPVSSVGMRANSLLTPAGSATTLTNVQASLRREGKTVLAMVGLPARGKTFMARHLQRHLSWMGYKTEIYNVGNYRRKILGAHQPADFFDPTNESGESARRDMARIACEEMVDVLRTDVTDIAIFDATNTTIERRRWLHETLEEAGERHGIKFQLVLVESICHDESIIRANVRETKLKSPDYKDLPETEAVSDFLARIRHYETIYQPITDSEESAFPYIKLIDVGRQIIANRINGFLNSRIMFFLSNLHITPRPIWLTRHGESEYNVQGRIGGDSMLAPKGHAYALRLGAFMKNAYPAGTHLTVWTSSLRRTMLTAAPIGREIVQWKALDEIDAGICDGMTYEAIAAKMPDEYAARARNKFTYRYPAGESYQDIMHRLEPVVIELMRQKDPILIVSHQATLRVLYAYLTDKPPESCPEVPIPLHTIIQLTPKAYGCEEVRHELM